MTRREKVRGAVAAAAFVLAAGCAKPPPPPPPPPPAPTFVPVPVKPQEKLTIRGVSAPAGPGKQSVAIFVNGERVIEGSLSTKSPHATLHGKYQDHDIEAKCTLAERVDCEILVDGEPESGNGQVERP